MTTKQISSHLVAVYLALVEAGDWRTVKEVAARAGIARRTADGHLRWLHENGVAIMKPLFGGFLYRIESNPSAGSDAIISELRQAADALAR